MTWRGVDDRDRAVASGVYLVRLVGGEAPQTQRVTLVR